MSEMALQQHSTSMPSVRRSEAPARAGEAFPPGRRSAKELLVAAKTFQEENRTRSWLHVVETFGVWAILQAVTIVVPFWYARLAAAIALGLVMVRAFILYHDYLHNAILRHSLLARAIMWLYGLYVLTPFNVWRQSHNYHHAHTAKIVGSHVGSYLMVTTDMWKEMTPAQRRMYKAVRHPLTIFFAYFTVFMYGMAASSFLRNPRKNWDSALALLINWTLTFLIWKTFGFAMFFFAMFIPLFVSTMSGAYLFYAQHNYPEINVQPRDTWEYTRAALESSSYMQGGPLMHWLTGNIGYHHVHHLNPGIPFYRLPEAMTAIDELQHPLGTTSLRPRDIARCFSAKLWDLKQNKIVGYPSESTLER